MSKCVDKGAALGGEEEEQEDSIRRTTPVRVKEKDAAWVYVQQNF